MAKKIMVQGTMSNAGKSLIAAGLCRILMQEGYKVAPFKSQNMALNSYVTEDGLEMGRAQVMQAEAAGTKPSVYMNPILLKPTSNVGSQVIVNGEPVGNMPAREYFEYKKSLVPEIRKAYDKLAEEYDVIVIEGAGSPAEINLKDNDIVNMGLADLLDAPVLIVGDIDRGGVFAQLYGTYALLTEEEQKRVKGFIINKFRGDASLLDSGISMIEEKCKVPVVGVIPYADIKVADEDSLADSLNMTKIATDKTGPASEASAPSSVIDIAVIKYPRVSNFTDFDVIRTASDISLRYVSHASELGNPDMIILPGSKNTMGDLMWLRRNGLSDAILKLNENEEKKRPVIFGICGGMQMLGNIISDPDYLEEGGEDQGLSLLPIKTVIRKEKIRKQDSGIINDIGGPLKTLSGLTYSGYEIHMGRSEIVRIRPEKTEDHEDVPVIINSQNVYGTYVHGIFDHPGIMKSMTGALAERKGITLNTGYEDYELIKEREYDKLADIIRRHMDMDFIMQILNENE